MKDELFRLAFWLTHPYASLAGDMMFFLAAAWPIAASFVGWAGGGPAPANPLWTSMADPVTMLVVAGVGLAFAFGAWTTVMEVRDQWDRGAIVPVYSEEEARLVLHLTPVEQDRVRVCVGKPIVQAALSTVTVFIVGLLFAWWLIAIIVATLSYPLLVALLRVPGNRRLRTLLSESAHAKAEGVTADQLRFLLGRRRFQSTAYYRKVLAEMDESPFEPETR